MVMPVAISHNPAGISALVSCLRTQCPDCGRVFLLYRAETPEEGVAFLTKVRAEHDTLCAGKRQ